MSADFESLGIWSPLQAVNSFRIFSLFEPLLYTGLPQEMGIRTAIAGRYCTANRLLLFFSQAFQQPTDNAKFKVVRQLFVSDKTGCYPPLLVITEHAPSLIQRTDSLGMFRGKQ